MSQGRSKKGGKIAASQRRKRKTEVAAGRSSGTLYVVATPIGNLEDITFRAVRILREVSLVASEDTRHSRKLLTHFGIRTPLISYYREKEALRAEEIAARLQEGKDVALVTDAGTPGISDPGGILVEKARKIGIRVVPVPGPSALTAALSVAGLQAGMFLFLGFLPSTSAKRKKFLTSIAARKESIVFYESPQRIVPCLRDCLSVLGDRWILLARELTKLHEELLHNRLTDVLENLKKRERIKGEIVVVVEGSDGEEMPQTEDLHALLVWFRDHSGLSLRDAVQRITDDLGMPRSEVYKEALKVMK